MDISAAFRVFEPVGFICREEENIVPRVVTHDELPYKFAYVTADAGRSSGEAAIDANSGGRMSWHLDWSIMCFWWSFMVSLSHCSIVRKQVKIEAEAIISNQIIYLLCEQ